MRRTRRNTKRVKRSRSRSKIRRNTKRMKRSSSIRRSRKKKGRSPPDEDFSREKYVANVTTKDIIKGWKLPPIKTKSKDKLKPKKTVSTKKKFDTKTKK